MTEHVPAISVVMAAYNAEAFLRPAIESILGQTFADFEFLIVEDGSRDGTWDIIREYASRDARIRPLRNEANLRLIRSLNRGIGAARAAWIARHDADDVSHPDRFERQMEFARAHPEVGVFGTQMRIINERDEPVGEYRTPLSHSLIVWNILFGRTLAHPTCFLRRALLEEVGGYQPGWLQAEDVDLWGRLAGRARFANMPDVLFSYRQLAQSQCRAKRIECADQQARIRRAFASRVVGRELPMRHFVWLRDYVRGYHALSAPQRRSVAELLTELYEKMAAAGMLLADEIGPVRDDLNAKLAGLQGGGQGAAAGGLQERLRAFLPRPLYLGLMALAHPGIAAERLQLEWRSRRRGEPK